MWGAWWVWDARLTSMFVLMLLYIGYMAIWAAIEEPHRAAMVARVVALVGFINIPIVKFSVDWWNTLHQPASVARLGGPSIHPSILLPLLWMGMAMGYGLVLRRALFGGMNPDDPRGWGLSLALGVEKLDDLAGEIRDLITPQMPKGFFDALKMLPLANRLKDLLPKTVSIKSKLKDRSGYARRNGVQSKRCGIF
jgi:hypothetical protein